MIYSTKIVAPKQSVLREINNLAIGIALALTCSMNNTRELTNEETEELIRMIRQQEQIMRLDAYMASIFDIPTEIQLEPFSESVVTHNVFDQVNLFKGEGK